MEREAGVGGRRTQVKGNGKSDKGGKKNKTKNNDDERLSGRMTLVMMVVFGRGGKISCSYFPLFSRQF